MSARSKEYGASTTTEASANSNSLLTEILERVDDIRIQQSRPSPVALRTWQDIERFAEKAAKSGMVPKDFIGKPDAICIAVQMGSELGLAPMQALQNIAVVNGRPSIWGDALPALVRASGLCIYIKEWHEGEGDDLTYFCETKRKNDPNPIRGQFSVAEAKQAGLWKETPTVTRRSRDGGTYQADSGPWYSYRPRMLQMRARGFCLRDAYPDVLKGLITTEEAGDIPFEETGLTPRIEPTRNIEAPASEPKTQTISQWLDELDIELRDAGSDGDAVDVILARDRVQKAQDHLTNGARERLNTMVQAALDRCAAAETSAPGDEAAEAY